MNNLSSTLKARRKELGLTLAQIADRMNVSEATVQRWESGNIKALRYDKVARLAEVLNVHPTALMGWKDESSSGLPSPHITEDTVTFPIITSVAAHYDSMSFNEGGVEGDNVEIPQMYLHGRPATDYCVMRVKGDSMYPDYRDGDLVLVLLQTTLDRPRDIGVIAYGDDEMTIKRIDYVPGEDWLEMIPINPHYPPKRIEDAELERCRVIGIPKLLIREL